MPKRNRTLDEYPEWIRTAITPTAVTYEADDNGSQVITLQDWDLPVTITMQSQIFMELNELTISVEPVVAYKTSSATITHGQLAIARYWTVYVLKERRTVEPTVDDNAIVMRASLVVSHYWGSDTTTAKNIAPASEPWVVKESQKFEDEKTGQGLLIAQKKLYLMVVENNACGAHTVTPSNQVIGFKAEFRFTDRVSTTEFVTDLIAQTH